MYSYYLRNAIRRRKMKFSVLVPRKIAQAGIDYLENNGCTVDVQQEMTTDELKGSIQHYDAVVLRTNIINSEIIANATKLKIIARYGVGLDNIDIEAATNRGIYVTNTPTANINSVAEHVVGLILSISRQINKVDRAVREGDFSIRNSLPGTELKGKILGILGLGNIGKLVAEKCALGFGMRVIAYDPYIDQPMIDYISIENDLERLIKQADFISLHLPYNTSNHHLFNKEKIGWIKRSAFLINAARGGLVDEEVLATSLKEKSIAGAALDVFEQEPPCLNHSLWELDNIIVTPHIAALTNEAMNEMSLDCAKEIIRIKNKEKPHFWVNKQEMTEKSSRRKAFK